MPAVPDTSPLAATGDDPPVTPSRQRLSALRHRNYRLLWTGQLISITGTWMQTVALAWLVLDLTDSPFDLSLVGVFQFGPMLFFGLIGGAIADRFPKRDIQVVTQTTQLLLAALLTTLVATDSIHLWHVYAIALGTGLANSVDMPTRQAFVSELVPKDDLMNAVALNSALFNTGRIVGPAIAGAVLAISGPSVCFGVNTASFLAVIISLIRMDLPLVVRPRSGSSLARIREGLAYVRVTPAVLLPMTLAGLIATFAMNFNVWIPLLAKHDLDAGAGGYGLLMSALGVGSLAGALFLAFRVRGPRRSLMLGGAAVLGCFEVALAFAGAAHVSTLLVLPLMAGLGYAMSTTTALASTTVQTVAPDALRGRVMSVYMTVFSGTLPIGSLAAGGLADLAGTPISIATGGFIAIAAAIAVWFVSRRVSSPDSSRTTVLENSSLVPTPTSQLRP